MPHMVIFRSTEGKQGYHQAETLEEAVRFVEHLRNQENVPETRIFRMQEVPIEFKTYVRVEVADAGDAAAPVAPAAVAAPAPAAAPVASAAAAPAVEAPAPAPAAAAAAAPAPLPETASKHDDVVVDPMPVGQGSGQAGSNRFGRFNRG
jgi:hypothetical protein